MNILLTLSQLEVTGAEVYAVTLADKLVDDGNTVYIISDTLTKKTKAKYIPVLFNDRRLHNRIKQIILLSKFIKRNNIDIIHSNSRAAGWISFFAAKICGIPKISTVHGEQAVHVSSRLIKIFGNFILPVCENIKEQLINEFKVNRAKVEVIRNGIEFPELKKTTAPEHKQKVISLIGRLSGPKGEIAFEIIKILDAKFKHCLIQVVGGKIIPDYLKPFQKENIKFIGFVDNLHEWIDNSDVVIGSGRVAIESIARGVNTVALGEACYAGFINYENVQEAFKSNFGDICKKRSFNWEKFESDVNDALNGNRKDSRLIEEIKQNFNVETFYNKISNKYQKIIVNYHQKEIPVLMYHRLIKDISEAGKHGIYVTVKQFTAQMHYLLAKGFTPITFKELSVINRFDKTKKYIILTFDDGYEDNYTLLFPILKRFGIKAVIFYVTHSKTNLWDTKNNSEREFNLMNSGQVAEMAAYGIEFGAHTKSHPDLTQLSADEAEVEIKDSKKEVETITGEEVVTFAYPYGKLNDEIKLMVKQCGFKYGIATDSGPLAMHEDLFNIRRIGIFPNTDYWGFVRKTNGNYTFKRVKRELARKG